MKVAFWEKTWLFIHYYTFFHGGYIYIIGSEIETFPSKGGSSDSAFGSKIEILTASEIDIQFHFRILSFKQTKSRNIK